MLSIDQTKNIYVYNTPVDMRKAVNGLSALLTSEFGQDPQCGDFFIFANKKRDRIKCLFWDKNGFVIYYKRVERGRFNYSKYLDEGEIKITETQFKALLFGLDFYLIGDTSKETYENFF